MPQPFTIDVPAAVAPLAMDASATLAALLGCDGEASASGHTWSLNAGSLRVRITRGAGLTLSVDASDAGRLDAGAAHGSSGHGSAASPLPGLEATKQEALRRFLGEHRSSLDHVGINVPARLVSEAQWRRFLDRLNAHWPVHVLQLPGSDVVAMALPPPRASAAQAAANALQAVELVYDSRAEHAIFHVCVRVTSDKPATEQRFPAPVGVYKPGDADYFRSVTADLGLAVPFYVDMAFAGAAFPAWNEIVAAMGRRWQGPPS